MELSLKGINAVKWKKCDDYLYSLISPNIYYVDQIIASYSKIHCQNRNELENTSF